MPYGGSSAAAAPSTLGGYSRGSSWGGAGGAGAAAAAAPTADAAPLFGPSPSFGRGAGGLLASAENDLREAPAAAAVGGGGGGGVGTGAVGLGLPGGATSLMEAYLQHQRGIPTAEGAAVNGGGGSAPADTPSASPPGYASVFSGGGSPPAPVVLPPPLPPYGMPSGSGFGTDGGQGVGLGPGWAPRAVDGGDGGVELGLALGAMAARGGPLGATPRLRSAGSGQLPPAALLAAAAAGVGSGAVPPREPFAAVSTGLGQQAEGPTAAGPRGGSPTRGGGEETEPLLAHREASGVKRGVPPLSISSPALIQQAAAAAAAAAAANGANGTAAVTGAWAGPGTGAGRSGSGSGTRQLHRGAPGGGGHGGHGGGSGPGEKKLGIAGVRTWLKVGVGGVRVRPWSERRLVVLGLGSGRHRLPGVAYPECWITTRALACFLSPSLETPPQK